MGKLPPLLSRHAFREAVFARDGHLCVICKAPAADAHHIMERRLWGESRGYYRDNGASLCALHHRHCEQTIISVEDVRQACGITKAVLPDHLYEDDRYDKWANPILPNGTRLRGELFFDPSVQKVLAEGDVLHLFTNRVRYPRTYHLPWSDGVHDDDRLLPSIERFVGQRVIVTEKMDGEQTSMYTDFIHARSLDGRHHPSRDWVKNLWGRIRYDIPPDWRVCCENLYAKHSIAYDHLSSFAYGFSVWDERNECLPWDDTKEWLEMLGIEPCPVIYDGLFDKDGIQALYDERRDWATREGYVVRIADGFSYGQYRHYVGKYVRRGHVQTSAHWMHGRAVEPNKLAASVR